MRTYAKDYEKKPRTQPYVTEKIRRERVSNEWDIRIDVDGTLTPQAIKESLVLDLPGLTYALISGIEVPDVQSQNNGSQGDHVHIALVFKDNVNRARALRACRAVASTDEYAVPRNRRFTYAGWLAHHAKAAFKKYPEMDHIFWEHGDLPEDPLDEDTCWKVVKILKKFATKEIKARFAKYYDELTRLKELPVTAVADNVTLPN